MSLAAKLPENLATKVICSIGVELRSLNIAQLACFLQSYGILNTSDFQALTNPQSTEADRRNTFQTCLLQLQTLRFCRKKLPTDLYLACLDSFEEDPALSEHHFFAVSTLRPKSKCVYEELCNKNLRLCCFLCMKQFHDC